MVTKLYKALAKIYRNPKEPGSFGGVERLLRSAKEKKLKVTRDQVKAFLNGEDAYTLHKPSRKRFARNETIVGDIDQQWQADLADLNDRIDENDGNRYLLTVIDCVSKYAWVVPVKRKDATSILAAFKQLFKQSAPRKPEKIQTDKGTEFLNKDLQAYFRKQKIIHFVTQNETKGSMVERFNKTLKNRMFTFFTANNTRRYMEVLPKLVDAYNNTYHTSIGMKPADVREKDVDRILSKIFARHSLSSLVKQGRIKKDTLVRISKTKGVFEKGYLPNWSTETFKVSEIVPRRRRVYKIRDYDDDPITGTFYPQELQEIEDKGANTVYRIEKILKKRKGKNGLELFIKWSGWPSKFNTWIPEANAKDIEHGKG